GAAGRLVPLPRLGGRRWPRRLPRREPRVRSRGRGVLGTGDVRLRDCPHLWGDLWREDYFFFNRKITTPPGASGPSAPRSTSPSRGGRAAGRPRLTATRTPARRRHAHTPAGASSRS